MSDKLTWVPLTLTSEALVDLNEDRRLKEELARMATKAFCEAAKEFLAKKKVTAPPGTEIVFAFRHGVAFAFAPKKEERQTKKGLTL